MRSLFMTLLVAAPLAGAGWLGYAALDAGATRPRPQQPAFVPGPPAPPQVFGGGGGVSPPFPPQQIKVALTPKVPGAFAPQTFVLNLQPFAGGTLTWSGGGMTTSIVSGVVPTTQGLGLNAPVVWQISGGGRGWQVQTAGGLGFNTQVNPRSSALSDADVLTVP